MTSSRTHCLNTNLGFAAFISFSLAASTSSGPAHSVSFSLRMRCAYRSSHASHSPVAVPWSSLSGFAVGLKSLVMKSCRAGEKDPVETAAVEYRRLMRKRLGLRRQDTSDESRFFKPLLELMEQQNLDFHSTFRTLSFFKPSSVNPSHISPVFSDAALREVFDSTAAVEGFIPTSGPRIQVAMPHCLGRASRARRCSTSSLRTLTPAASRTCGRTRGACRRERLVSWSTVISIPWCNEESCEDDIKERSGRASEPHRMSARRRLVPSRCASPSTNLAGRL
ncbi:hypothetical protein BDZ97DRAFT_904592 [Flammula alnicola]|nr:hypothetical protein BDZ97DRAFT_904592 [Flammula alnicola]